MYDCVAQAEGDRLGAGDPRAAAGNVLRRHAEQAACLPHQHVLAVAQEGEAAAVEGHVVGVARGDAHAAARRLSAVPATLLAHTGMWNSGGESGNATGSKRRKCWPSVSARVSIFSSVVYVSFNVCVFSVFHTVQYNQS